MTPENHELTSASPRREHRLEHSERNARFVGEPGHGAVPGIEMRTYARFLRERVVPPVIGANAIPVSPIRAGAAEALDPGMFVRWNRL
jgi:hypothetical protein